MRRASAGLQAGQRSCADSLARCGGGGCACRAWLSILHNPRRRRLFQVSGTTNLLQGPRLTKRKPRREIRDTKLHRRTHLQRHGDCLLHHLLLQVIRRLVEQVIVPGKAHIEASTNGILQQRQDSITLRQVQVSFTDNVSSTCSCAKVQSSHAHHWCLPKRKARAERQPCCAVQREKASHVEAYTWHTK